MHAMCGEEEVRGACVLYVVVLVMAALVLVAMVVVGFLLMFVACADVLMCCDADALRCCVGCSCVSLRTLITIWRELCHSIRF